MQNMSFIDLLGNFTALDGTAFLLLILSWVIIGWLIEREGTSHPSVTILMNTYRRDWMAQMVTREPRIFDSQIVGNLRQGTAFFASACMISIGGAIALIGNTEQLLGVADDLALDAAPALVWEVKLFTATVIIGSGLLRFIWAHRLFGYCSVIMAAVPNDRTDPTAYPRAAQAAELNITAARNFNRGIRAIYFALASFTWLLGPIALLGGTAAAVWVISRREFASQSRKVILGTS